MVVRPENNFCKFVSCSDLYVMIYSTFDVGASVAGDDAVDSSAGFVGPVCVIGTTRSVFCWTVLRDAVMVSTPSDDNDDCTSFGFVFAVEIKSNY